MLFLLFICFIAGSIGGLLQGMVGVGVGIVIIPLLTFLLPHYGIPADTAIHVALATSMGAITASSISSIISHHKQGNIRWLLAKKIVAFSVLGSCLGALLASYLPGRLLEIVFALFMFYTAAKMLRSKKTEFSLGDEAILSQLKLATGGFFIGFTASIVGIGGGLFMVPFLHAHRIPMRYAVGTATLVGLPVAIIGTATYIVTGLSHSQNLPMMWGYLYWPALLAIAIGAIIFAALGAKLIKTMKPLVLQRIFAICIIVVGVKMLW